MTCPKSPCQRRFQGLASLAAYRKPYSRLDAKRYCVQYRAIVSDESELKPGGTNSPPPRPSALVAGLAGRPIILVGMMGSGKSSIGKRLAVRLGIPFKDADAEIEAAANASIEEIFEQHGEEYFRNGERRVIKRLLGEAPVVVATGGGAFADPDTRKQICETGIAIWLKADYDVLLTRVRRRGNRPLLKGPDPEGTLKRLIEERYPAYEEAPIHIHSREVSHDVVIEEVLQALDRYLAENPAPGNA